MEYFKRLFNYFSKPFETSFKSPEGILETHVKGAKSFHKVIIQDKIVNLVGVSHLYVYDERDLSTKPGSISFEDYLLKIISEKPSIDIYYESPLKDEDEKNYLHEDVKDEDTLKVMFKRFYKNRDKFENVIFSKIDPRYASYLVEKNYGGKNYVMKPFEGSLWTNTDILTIVQRYISDKFDFFHGFFFPKSLTEEIKNQDPIRRKIEVIDFLEHYMDCINYGKKIDYEIYSQNIFIMKCLKPIIKYSTVNYLRDCDGELKHPNYFERKKNNGSIYEKYIDFFFSYISKKYKKAILEIIESSSWDDSKLEIVIFLSIIMDFYCLNRLIHDITFKNSEFFLIAGNHHALVYRNFFDYLKKHEFEVSVESKSEGFYENSCIFF